MQLLPFELDQVEYFDEIMGITGLRTSLTRLFWLSYVQNTYPTHKKYSPALIFAIFTCTYFC